MSGRMVALVIALAAAFSAAAADRVCHGVDTVVGSMVIPLDSAALEMAVEVRAVPTSRGKSWSFSGGRWRVDIGPENLNSDISLIEPEMVVSVSVDGGEAWSGRFGKGFNFGRGESNSMAVTLRKDSMIEVAAGGTVMMPLVRLPLAFSPLTGVCRVAARDSNLKVTVAVSETVPDRARQLLTGWTADALAARLASSVDPLEGVWTYFDRENDPAHARPGGRYRLAVVAAGDGSYDLIYTGGAEVNSSAWLAGMRKGRLVPTPFEGNYDLVWYDAMMEPVENDVSATVADGLMTLNFPLMKTRLRFSRQPAGS